MALAIGGFIGTPEAQAEWLQPPIDRWLRSIQLFARAARQYPQAAFAGLTKSLQAEWTYLQWVVPDVGKVFAPVEKALAEDFLPALLGDLVKTTTALRDLLAFPVQFAGIGVLDPRTEAKAHFDMSRGATAALISSLPNSEPLDTQTYSDNVKSNLKAQHEERQGALQLSLNRLSKSKSPKDQHRITRGQSAGAWLTATPHILNGTVLTAEEFRDNLRLRFGLTPKHLPARCDGCSAQFTVEHAMTCPRADSLCNDTMISQGHGTNCVRRPGLRAV